jgi:type VI secretion system protein ImpK
LQQLLGRSDSSDLADLLEVYYLCMLLGFSGRYSAGNRGELAQAMTMTKEKIHRIRGRFAGLSPAWMLPREAVAAGADPWVRKLGWIAGIAGGVMVLLFILYKLVLGSGVQV